MCIRDSLGVSLVSVNAYNARTNELAVDSGAYVAVSYTHLHRVPLAK